jgi:gamma-glutamyltranspeptidase/glutathione hydrolase
MRAAMIGARAGPAARGRDPPGATARAADRTLEAAGTSHFTIVDREGDVVSMTTTVEAAFAPAGWRAASSSTTS